MPNPVTVTVDMRRRRDHHPPPVESTKTVMINLDRFQVATTTTTRRRRTRTKADEKVPKTNGELDGLAQKQCDDNKMIKWIRLDAQDEEMHEMNDYKYAQQVAHKTNSGRRRWRRPVGRRPSLSSSWTLTVGGGPSLVKRTRTKLSKRRFRVQSFIMRKLSTLSQILFMFICLALIGASISEHQLLANCEQQPEGQQVGGTATNSSSGNSKLEIQRSPRANAGGAVDLLATHRRARQQTTTTSNGQLESAAATNKFDIERKPQAGDNQNNNAAKTRTSGNYGEKQQRPHEDLSSLSTVDLNLTNSIEFNSAAVANGASLSSGSIVVLASGRPKYENYPIDPSARFDGAPVQSPFAADDFWSAHSGQSAADDNRQRAHESADLSAEQQWRQTNTTTDGGRTVKRNFLDASLEAQAKLRDTVQQLHYNKSLGFERTTAPVNNSSSPSTSGTVLSPAALADVTHETRYPIDQSNLLPSSAPANYLFAHAASGQLVSVSPTSAPSQLIEYANSRDPLETAASADEVRQRHHNDSRPLKTTTTGTDWGRRKSASALTGVDNELGSGTASEDHATRSAPASSPYEDIVTWTPAAGPAAYRAGSGYQPSQRADNNLTGGEPEANSISEPNENFYAPAVGYSLAASTNATRRSDGDSPVEPVAGSSVRPSVAPKRRSQPRPQQLAFKTRAPRVQPPVDHADRSRAPANAPDRGHFGSDEADSRQSARYSDLAGRERAQRPRAESSVAPPDESVDRGGPDRVDSADFDERGQPPPPAIVPKVKRKKSKRAKMRQQVHEPEPERNSIDASEPEEDTQQQLLAPSRKVESEPPADEGQDQDEPEQDEPPPVSSSTPRPAQVARRKKTTSRQQVAGAPKLGNGRQNWKQSSNKQGKHSPRHGADKEAFGQAGRVQWSQLDVSGSSSVKAAAAEGAQPAPQLPIFKTFRLAEPKVQSLLEKSSQPTLPAVNNLNQAHEDPSVDSNVRNTNQAPLYVAPKSLAYDAIGTETQTHQLSDQSHRASASFRPLLAPVGQFQAVEQTRRTNQQQQQQRPQQAYSAASASTNQLIGREQLDDQQRQNWSVVVLPYPKPVENAQSYFGSLPLARQQTSPASEIQQQAFNTAAESQRYAAAPPIVWPTQPASEIGQQLAVVHRQQELMQQQQQQMGASAGHKLIQRGTRDAPAEMRAPDNTLTINLSTRAVGPNQLFWAAAAREAAAQQQQQQQRLDAHKVPVSNGHTPPQHRESRQSGIMGASLPMMRRPLAAMRHQQHLRGAAFGSDQAGSAPGGSVYPNADAYTNGHAYAGSTLKGPQLAAALDSLRTFNEFAHFQQASSNEFAFADPLANANHFYSFAGANPFETTPPQQQQQVAASDAFTSLLQQSGYGPAASFFPTSAQASAMAGGGGQTNNNSQFVKKGSAQLIASTPPMATPAGVRDPFGWPLAYGSQAAKSLLQINQVAPAPNYLIPSDKLKELAVTSQQQQKSLRPTIESAQDLPSATSWNPNQAVAAAFPLWAAASAPAPVAVRPSSSGDLTTAASSSGPQNIMRVQISTRAPTRRERFWKRLRLFRRSPQGEMKANLTRRMESDDAHLLLELDHEFREQKSKQIALMRHKRSPSARESLREQLAKRTPVGKLVESWRHMRTSNRSTPTNKKSHTPHGSASLDLGAAESQAHSQVIAPPKLAMINQEDGAHTGHASSTRTAFIPLLDTSNLIDNLESDLLAQALLFSQRQHMQRLAAASGPSGARQIARNYINGQLLQQLDSAPQAQFLLPSHSMQMVSHTPLYANAPASGEQSATAHSESDDLNQLAGSFQQTRLDTPAYGLLMQAAASMHNADGQHLEPPANEPGFIPNTRKDQQASGAGPRARIKQLSSQLMKQSRKPLTKLMQMTNFTSRFHQPPTPAASPISTNATGAHMTAAASSLRPVGHRQTNLSLKMPLPGHFAQGPPFNQPLMMSHYLGAGGLGPYQEMMMMMNQQQLAMQPSMTVSQHQQLLFPAAFGRPVSNLQASTPAAFGGQQRPAQTVGANFNARPRDVNHAPPPPPPTVSATVIAGNLTHSYGQPVAAASNEASHSVRFAEVPTSYARLFAPANAPHSAHQSLPPAASAASSQRAHERADEIGQLIGGLKLIKQSLQEKSSELTGGDALRRASGSPQQLQFPPPTNTIQDFRSHHHRPHHLRGSQVEASRRQQVKVSPTLAAPRGAHPAHQQQQFVHQVSTSPSFKFVSAPPPPPRSHPNSNNNDEQATLLAAAAAASQHEHDFSSYLGNFPRANYTDAEIFSSPSDQQPVETGAHELTGEDEQHQQLQAEKMSIVEQPQQQNMIALDDPNSVLAGSGQDEEQGRQQQQLIDQQTQQQPGGNFVSQDEAQFQRQQQNAFLQMQQFGGSNLVVQPRPRLPKFSIPSINSITSKFRQHLYQAFKLNPMGSGSSRWPTMLASPASYMSYQQQQPSGFTANYPVQQQQQVQQPPPQPQQVNFRPAGVQLQPQQLVSQPEQSFSMEPSASNYYDVARQPPAHFQPQEFSMSPHQHQHRQRVQMVRPPVMQVQHQLQPTMNFASEGPVNSNRVPRRQQMMTVGQVQPQQLQQHLFVSSAPTSITANQMNNNNRQRSFGTTTSQQHNSMAMTDQYGNHLMNQTQTSELGMGPYQQQVVGEQTISDNEIVGLGAANGTQSIAQAILMAGGNNLTMTSQQEFFPNQTHLAQDEQQPNPLQGLLTEINGNLIASDESYIQEDQLELTNQQQQQQQSYHDGGAKSSEQAMAQPEGDTSSQTRQPEESQQQQENIAIKSQDQQQPQVVISGDPGQRDRDQEVYDRQQQHQVADSNTGGQAEGSQDQRSHVTMMLEPDGGGQQQQQQHYELERVVTTSGPANSTSVRPAAGSRLPRPTKGRPSSSRPGQRQKQPQRHRQVDYQVIRASSDVSASQQPQSYMEVPQIVHLSNGTIDNHRQTKKLHSPLFKHAATRPVHQNQLQRQSTNGRVGVDAANETQSQQQDIRETTTSDRFIVPAEEHEIDPNPIELYHDQRLHQSQDGAEQQQQQQPAQILHGSNQILVAAGPDGQEQFYGHSMADNEVEQQLDNQLAGRPLNWRLNTTLPSGSMGQHHNASLQYDFRPVELGGEQRNSTGSLASHEQLVLIDQPVVLTGGGQPTESQAASQVESSQYGQVNEGPVVVTPKLDAFDFNSSATSSSSLSGSEQPAVFVSIKPERVLQPTPPQTGGSSPPSPPKGSQHQNRKRPLKMPKRAPANLLLVQDQRASESSGASLRTNRPPGMIVPTANATTSSTTTTTSTTSRPTQARRANDTRNHNHNHKSVSSAPSSVVSLKDSYTRAPKARIRWQGAHHSPTIGGGGELANGTSPTAPGNKTTPTSAANDNQAAWIINGMTHEAYSSPRPLNESRQETSVTISQVPFSNSSSSSSSPGLVAANHNYGANRTQPARAPPAAHHKLATPASEPTSARAIPANHRAISTEVPGGEPPRGRADSPRTGSTSFKLSSGTGGSGAHSSPAALESGPSAAPAANLSTAPRPTTQPPRVNQLIDGDSSFLLASATESSQVALDQMLAAASGDTTRPNATTQVVSPAAIVRRSEPAGGEPTSGNQTTPTLAMPDEDQPPPPAFDDAETFHAGDWAREFASARSESEPRIPALAASAGKLQPLSALAGELQLPLAVRIRMRQQQQRGHEELEATTAAARLLSQSNETGDASQEAHDEMRMRHADR